MESSTTNVNPTTIGINVVGSIPCRRDPSGSRLSVVTLVVGVVVGIVVVGATVRGEVGVVKRGGHLFSSPLPPAIKSPVYVMFLIVVVMVVDVVLVSVLVADELVVVSVVVVVDDVVDDVVVGAPDTAINMTSIIIEIGQSRCTQPLRRMARRLAPRGCSPPCPPLSALDKVGTLWSRDDPRRPTMVGVVNKAEIWRSILLRVTPFLCSVHHVSIMLG